MRLLTSIKLLAVVCASVVFGVAVCGGATATTASVGGPYLYTKEIENYASYRLNGCELHAPVTIEMWIGADGSGLTRSMSTTPPTLIGSAGRSCAQTLKQASADEPSEMVYAPNCNGSPFATARLLLTTNVAQLRRYLIARAGGAQSAQAPWNVFSAAPGWVGEVAMSPALRVALYNVLSTLPGVHRIGRVHDPMGRVGLGLELGRGDVGLELVYNPSTKALLAQMSSGSLDDDMVYLRTETVNSLPPGTPNAHPPCTAPDGGIGTDISPSLTIMTGPGPGKPGISTADAGK